MQYWLFKSEPGCFSIQDLLYAPHHTTSWDGVRNYQARNFMRAMRTGDEGFFYHSGKRPEIAGIVRICREAYPDHTSWDPANSHFDPSSTPEHPRWFMVDVQLVALADPPLRRSALVHEPELMGMELLKKGSRLSVQPVDEAAFKHICAMMQLQTV